MNSANKFMNEKKKEFESYKPQATSGAGKDGMMASSSYQQDNPEKDAIINELQERNESLMAEVNKARVNKQNLDTKFLESVLFEDLSKQLLDVVSYSMTLKNHLDRAEKNLIEIQTRRNSELSELYDRTNEEKLRLNTQISSLNRELSAAKDKQVELQRKLDSQMSITEDSGMTRVPVVDHNLEKLQEQLQAFAKELEEEKTKLRNEHHRVYKYEKELQNVKENHYNELLNKYQVCEGMEMRHSRHQEIFSRLYKINNDHNAGLKDDLDELTKYVKTRDEKINHLDKKWKKLEKELDAERKQCLAYIKEIEQASAAFTKLCKENEQFKKELNEMNSNFNKVYKEKTTDKQGFEYELLKIQNDNKFWKEQVPALKTNLSSLNKNLASKEKLVVSWIDQA